MKMVSFVPFGEHTLAVCGLRVRAVTKHLLRHSPPATALPGVERCAPSVSSPNLTFTMSNAKVYPYLLPSEKSDSEICSGERNDVQPLPPLDLVPTDALLDELKLRYPTGLVVLRMPDPTHNTRIIFTRSGSQYEAREMCRTMAKRWK